MTGATPRPWKRGWRLREISGDGRVVATIAPPSQHPASEARANADAALIVRAVNAHDELVAALRAIMAALDQPVQTSGLEDPGTCRILRGDAAHAWELARAALARIKGEA